MKKYSVIFVIVALNISGCATPKEWSAIGGSRSDGVVRLAFEYRFGEKPVLDKQQGLDLAKTKCLAWGFKDAEAFGAATKKCNGNPNDCRDWLVTKEYQCLGTPDK